MYAAKVQRMRHIRHTVTAFGLLLAFAAPAFAAGNTVNASLSRAKKYLAGVYADHRITIYCAAPYDERGNTALPANFTTLRHQARASRIEWDSIVPAESFGRAFAEWREGDPACVDNHGNPFRGRACAEKASMEYRYMQADMHNLAPAIGAVSAMRQNSHFTMLPGAKNTFGSCAMKIEGNKVEPPEAARGIIARTYKYMAQGYPRYKMDGPTAKLMDAWDKMYPPDAWECARARRIAKIQGNANEVTEARCREAGL